MEKAGIPGSLIAHATSVPSFASMDGAYSSCADINTKIVAHASDDESKAISFDYGCSPTRAHMALKAAELCTSLPGLCTSENIVEDTAESLWQHFLQQKKKVAAERDEEAHGTESIDVIIIMVSGP